MEVDPAIAEVETRYCSGCPLRDSEYVIGYGHSDCPVMVVGTAPGRTEELTGLAFTSENGRLLREMLDGLGVEAYFTNVLKRRPVDAEGKNRKPNKKECWKCGSHLVQEIVRNRPRAVLTLGHTPTEFMLGTAPTALSTSHGLPLRAQRFALSLLVVPTYDLGFISRNGGLNSKVGDEWMQDVQDFASYCRREGV